MPNKYIKYSYEIIPYICVSIIYGNGIKTSSEYNAKKTA